MYGRDEKNKRIWREERKDHVDLLSVGECMFVIQKFKDQDIHITIILPVVLYGCETWSLILREY